MRLPRGIHHAINTGPDTGVHRVFRSLKNASELTRADKCVESMVDCVATSPEYQSCGLQLGEETSTAAVDVPHTQFFDG